MRRPHRTVLSLTCAVILGACATAAEPPPRVIPDPEASAWRDATGQRRADAAREPPPAVTHLGRTLLPRTGLVVRGRCTRSTEAVAGVEIARVQVEEVLRELPWDRPDGDELTVFCGEPGMLPRRGQQAVLLVARRPGSPNYDIVQSVPLVGAEGDERLAALRTYLRIEDVADEQERVAELLTYLRDAVRDPRRWTRANAALEYGSLAGARPGDLTADDAVVLRAAAARASDPDTRRALGRALEVAERKAGVAVRRGVAEDGGAAPPDLADLLERFAAATEAMDRRGVVVEAGVGLGASGRALFERALDDADPRVREAGIAAAGQFGVAALGPRISTFLTHEGEPLPLRRSAVRAVGLLRVQSAVPVLAAIAGNDTPLGEDACYALARVRDTDAVAALGALLPRAEGERRELLEFLLSERFVTQEERLGHTP